MKNKPVLIGFLILTLLPSAAQAGPVGKSTAADQTGMEVTVYNNGLGLVKDIRKVQIGQGQGELRFMDVAAQIMPVTVHVRSLNDPARFEVLEQNYEYDLMSEEKLLDKYVGKKIKLVEDREFQDRKEVVEATLLSNNNGQIYQVGNEIYLGHPGIKVLPEIPENLIAKPTLTWFYANQSPKPHQLEVSYLTNNLSWKADYVFVVGKDDNTGDLAGWVTIDNQSGAAYRDAVLKLVAGQVNRVPEFEGRAYMMADAAAPVASRAKAAFVEQAFFEYHIYDLQRKTTIKDNQTKQISLLEGSALTLQKEFIVAASHGYWTARYQGELPKEPVNVYIKFKNSKENNLGMPLPAGVMRLYKKDHQEKLQFIGEDRIEHTPKDEEVRLKLGEAFDVRAERVQKDFKQITTQLYESEWEITLRNHKKEDIKVKLVEPLYGSWQVIKNSHPYTKKDAQTIEFEVPVPKDKEVKVTYRVKVGI